MDTHTDTAVADTAVADAIEPEVSAVEQLPDAEPDSFADALESALSNIESSEVNSEGESIVDGESPELETPTEVEPTPEVEDTPEVETTTEVEDTTEAETTDPLESLTEDVDDWTPKAATRFKQLKAELKDNLSEVDKLRQTVKEQESKMQEMAGLVENRDIDELQKRVATYEEEKVLVNLEGTLAYKEAVTEPLMQLMARADELSDQYEVDKDILIDVIALTNEQEQDAGITKLMPEISARDKAKIYRIVEDLKPVLERRDHLAKNAEAAYQEAQLLEDQRRNTEAAERADVRTNVTRNVVKRINEKLPFLSGVENLDMEAIQTKASALDPNVVHPVDFAYNAVAAQLLPIVVREYISSRKESDVLTDKLSEYEGAEPTMSGTPSADGVQRAPTEGGFAAAIEAAFGG